MSASTASAAWWIAMRELRAGSRGFRVFLACLALGVWAIAGAGSMIETLKAGLDQEARTLLGGDVEISVLQRTASDGERARIEAMGPASRVLDTSAMGRVRDRREFVDVRGVDAAYPLLGTLSLEEGATLDGAFQLNDGVYGAVVGRSLLETFEAEPGDIIELGGVEFEIRGVVETEPDRLGGSGFWPRFISSNEAIEAAGLAQTGALFRESFRVLLDDGADLEAWREDAGAAFEEEGFRVEDRNSAAEGLGELLDMMQAFLAVVGLATLIAGGVGVAQATTAFLASRIPSIAALKALGADGGVIRRAYLIQIAALSGAGLLIGAALGALTPFIIEFLFGDRIPLPARLGVYPGQLLGAVLLGALTALVFALPALGRARATSPASLFRGPAEKGRRIRPWAEYLAAAVCAAAFVAAAAFASPRPLVTLALLGGALFAFVLLLGAAQLVMFAARRAAPRARGFAAIGLANLGGPGSIAPIAATALGLGVALLTLVAVVQTNLVRQITETAPSNLPSVIFTQIPSGEGAAFDAHLAAAGVAVDDVDSYRRAPRLIGRITGINGEPLVREDVDPSERWIIDGSIGLTFSSAPPPEAEITEGEWWPEDYSGPALISIEGDAARGLGAAIGDRMTFRILGREVEAEVANYRRIDWGGFGSNFAVIFAPGTLEAANPVEIAVARTTPETEAGLSEALEDDFPGVNVIRLRAAMAAASEIFEDLTLVVNALAGIALAAGGLVLIGAFAAAARRRAGEAALLKTLGASRAGVLGLFAAEFAAAGLIAAGIGAAMGAAAAWPIVIFVFEAEWAFPFAPVLLVLAAAAGAAALGGAMTGAQALARPPARVLRAE